MNDIKVIGIDPAPKKGATIFDGKNPPITMNHCCFSNYITGLQNSEETVLICWDAPLTGPYDFINICSDGNFTKRPIEKFLSAIIHPGNGANTQGYASCQHWTITKHFFGLPDMGGCDKSKNSFILITDEDEKPIANGNGKYIVEVHPAIAIYLWLDGEMKPYKKQKYKKDSFNNEKDKPGLNFNWDKLIIKWGEYFKVEILQKIKPIENNTDDELDAIVAWVLGNEWVNVKSESSKVKLLGNEKTGAMLLPYDTKLFCCGNNFLNDPKNKEVNTCIEKFKKKMKESVQ